MKIRLLVGVVGDLAGHSSPAAGDIIDVHPRVAQQWADGERAELVDEKPIRKAVAIAGRNVETAAVGGGETRG